MKYKTTLESEVVVEYSDPELAEEFFIRGDWRNVFFQFDDLTELTEFISLAVFNEREHFFVENRDTDEEFCGWVKDIEGFAPFMQQAQDEHYTSENPEYGKIIVWYEDLDIGWTPEVVE